MRIVLGARALPHRGRGARTHPAQGGGDGRVGRCGGALEWLDALARHAQVVSAVAREAAHLVDLVDGVAERVHAPRELAEALT